MLPCCSSASLLTSEQQITETIEDDRSEHASILGLTDLEMQSLQISNAYIGGSDGSLDLRENDCNHALYSVVDTEGTVTHNIPMHKIEDCIRQNQSRKTTKAHRLPRRQVWEVTQYHYDGQIGNARTALKDYAMHGRRPYTRDPLRISRDTND